MEKERKYIANLSGEQKQRNRLKSMERQRKHAMIPENRNLRNENNRKRYANLTSEQKEARLIAARAWRKNNRSKVAASEKNWAQKNRERINFRQRLYIYGIDKETYERIYAECKGMCQICGKPEKLNVKGKLFIDHDHKTGKFRGFLCSPCNHALGNLKDNIELFENAISYLKKHSSTGAM